MRLLRLLFFALLFAAGEVAVPVVSSASEALEEVSEETQHANGRRRGEREAAAVRSPSPGAAAVQAAHRPSVRVLSRTAERNHRSGLRKVPPPSSASSSAPEEDH